MRFFRKLRPVLLLFMMSIGFGNGVQASVLTDLMRFYNEVEYSGDDCCCCLSWPSQAAPECGKTVKNLMKATLFLAEIEKNYEKAIRNKPLKIKKKIRKALSQMSSQKFNESEILNVIKLIHEWNEEDPEQIAATNPLMDKQCVQTRECRGGNPRCRGPRTVSVNRTCNYKVAEVEYLDLILEKIKARISVSVDLG